MKVIIAGGTGFLGRPLSLALANDGHDVVVLSRPSTPREPQGRPEQRRRATGSGRAAATGTARSVEWTPNGASGPWASTIDAAGAAVNLAAEPIPDNRG